MHSKELRQKFRDFFLARNHKEIPSASLIPSKDDPTVLLTTAGMQPLVPYLMGAPHPVGNRLFDTQKSFRTPDIEEVGDDTHHTFFEMLGNWSLGDYFKEEAIELAYDFFVDVLKLDPARFGITIFKGDADAPRDTEAEQIWLAKGLKKEQIFEFDKKDNFWGPAGKTGPCGPCSEIHYDRGEKYGENYGPNCDENQRFVEIWNLVFMEFNKKEDGTYEKLAQKNVDTGVGFERLLSILNEKDSSFDTDLFTNILAKIEELSGKKYADQKRGFRIVADHIRGATFLIADGVIPGNTGRDYVLRRVIRRAALHGKKLGIKGAFLSKIAATVIADYSEFYPELKQRKEHIFTTFNIEEENFLKTLERGEKLLSEALAQSKKISGKKAFELFDTYGFPLEITTEIAAEQGAQVDEEGFKKEMEAQKERSRAKSGEMFERKADLADFEKLPATVFLRDKIMSETTTLEAKQAGDIVFVALAETPFYAESGGQVADEGTINGMEVLDVQKNHNGVFIHTVKGTLEKSAKVKAAINSENREQIKRHHSLAHLLQAAMRQVLGNHVEQQGSMVNATRARFDFSHPKALTHAEIAQIEEIIAKWVADAAVGATAEMPIEEAQKKGAMALFSEKFAAGQKVRVVSFGDVSAELCGGTHITNTAEIGAIKIVSESSVSAGIRRIEIICSQEAQKLLIEQSATLAALAEKLKTQPTLLMERIESLLQENKTEHEARRKAEHRIADLEAAALISQAREIKGKKVLIAEEAAEKITDLARALAKKVDLAVLFAANGAIAVASQKGIAANGILKAITTQLGGSGGGSDTFAQGGGVKVASAKIEEIVKESL